MNNCPGITSVIINTNQPIITAFNAASCNLTGAVNFSNQAFGGSFDIGSNPLLTSLTIGTSGANTAANSWVSFKANNTGLAGTLNIPGANWSTTSNSVTLDLTTCPSITGLTFGGLVPSATKFKTFSLFGCTGLTAFAIPIWTYFTQAPNNITGSLGSPVTFDFRNIGMTSGLVDYYLVGLDSIAISAAATQTRIIYIF